MIFSSNKSKVRRELELLKKVRRPGELTEKPSGLKLQESPLPAIIAGRAP